MLAASSSGDRVQPTDIIVKTADGAAEVAARSAALPQRLRTMLILVDGKLTAGQLTEAASKLGVPSDFLDALAQQGLIAVRPAAQPAAEASAPAPVELSEAERFRIAQKFMNDTVVDALGFRALFFTLKLEKSFSIPDLRALLDDYTKLIAKRGGKDAARMLAARVRDLLR